MTWELFKVKGFPNWSAIIDDTVLNSKTYKYNVTFCVNKETGLVSEANVLRGSKQNMNRKKTLKYKNNAFNNVLTDAGQHSLTKQSENENKVVVQDKALIFNILHLWTFGWLPRENQTKRKPRRDSQGGDLETSLTLVAEVGNALLDENNKLRENFYNTTLQNLQLAKKIEQFNNLDNRTRGNRD